MNTIKLRDTERNLFTRITKAIVTNPFSDERMILDAEISGLSLAYPRQKQLERVITIVYQQVDEMCRQQKADVRLYRDNDRYLVRNTLLFYFFHKYINQFDQLIQDQITGGDFPVEVAFADQAIIDLESFGFNDDEAARIMAICFQLRRAFYFIKKNIIGPSRAMKELRKNLWFNVFTHNFDAYFNFLWSRMEDFSTLILGATGTGKGTSAVAIGKSGYIPFDLKTRKFVESFNKSFITINLSQFPENLLESELFGHKKGAFTGAIEDHPGVFQRCSRYGSIFIDEIGEVSIPIQIKLLQVIQERIFYPVGSHEKKRFEGRIIAATNRPLNRLRAEKKFRDDFYYRLCSDIIVMPGLKERIDQEPEELDDLIEYLTHTITGRKSREIEKLVKKVITDGLDKNYQWPGNVRELEQCIRSVILKNSYTPDSAPSGGTKNETDTLFDSVKNGSLTAEELLRSYCTILYKRFGSYGEVARKTGLDWRTVKKYV